MIANYHVLNAKDFKNAKFDIWDKVINLAAKAFKVQSKSTNSTTSKKKKSKTNSKMEENEFTHIEYLSSEDLLRMKDRRVFIDPSRWNILYCMKETNTAEKKKVFRFTFCERSKNSRRYRYLRKELKPAIIQSAELVLAEIPSSTVDQQEVL
jgi:hypothetical protein